LYINKYLKALLCSLIILSLAPIQYSSTAMGALTEVNLGDGGDGWSSVEGGTTGGAAADPRNMYTVTNRKELLAALGGQDAVNNSVSKVVYVKGTIDMNVNENNQPVGMKDYEDPAYDFEAYLNAYDPKGSWGKKTVPSGPLETARRSSQLNQASRIQYKVGSNTSIVGLGTDAKIINGNLLLDKKADGTGVDNIIVRNIEFQDAYDYFPSWDPTDGMDGNWNSQYDMITVKSATHVLIDHCVFGDGNRPDTMNGTYFGRIFQHHDGAVDVTNAANWVTLSYNYMHSHDKTMLIGSSDTGNTAAGDTGKLKVTIHHNYFDDVVQRVPRVRFGQVHVYNNYYHDIESYALGRGILAQIYSEANYFEHVPKIIDVYDGKGAGYVLDTGSVLVDSALPNNWTPADEWNSKVNWLPSSSYAYKAEPAEQGRDTVVAKAGTLRADSKSILFRGFADLKGHWAKDDVELLASRQIVNGVSNDSFGPGKPITRAEFAALLVRAQGLQEEKTGSFSDIKEGDWYKGVIGAAAKAGLIEGGANGTFQPNAGITREEMIVMLSRALKTLGKAPQADSGTLARFVDSGAISSWAKEAAAQGVLSGILNGTSDNLLKPNQQASRAEAAVMLKRCMVVGQLLN
jgi:pectate lyase